MFLSTETNISLVLSLDCFYIKNCLGVKPYFLKGESISSMPILYCVARLAMVWLCCFWHLLILSLVCENFSLAIDEVSLIFHQFYFHGPAFN